jgi:hypothetical protein
VVVAASVAESTDPWGWNKFVEKLVEISFLKSRPCIRTQTFALRSIAQTSGPSSEGPDAQTMFAISAQIEPDW